MAWAQGRKFRELLAEVQFSEWSKGTFHEECCPDWQVSVRPAV